MLREHVESLAVGGVAAAASVLRDGDGAVVMGATTGEGEVATTGEGEGEGEGEATGEGETVVVVVDAFNTMSCPLYKAVRVVCVAKSPLAAIAPLLTYNVVKGLPAKSATL